MCEYCIDWIFGLEWGVGREMGFVCPVSYDIIPR